jgi:serine/threonine protein kinase
MITEYMENGDLREFLRSSSRQDIGLQDQIGIGLKVCSAMVFLAAKRVVHRDLAAR